MLSFPNNNPAEISQKISEIAAEARNADAQVWVDLTSGPKPRAAIMLGAASALPDAKIICCENTGKEFRVTQIPSLEQYNSWLGPHGLIVRNYNAEIKRIQDFVKESDSLPTLARLSDAIRDLLGWNPSETHQGAIGPRTDLTIIAEWIAKKAVPRHLLGILCPQGWKGKSGQQIEADILKFASSEAMRAAARSSQSLYKLRCLFSHPANWKKADVIFFLDILSYLIETIGTSIQSPIAAGNDLGGEGIYVAVDGDDVGRRFEEQLAEATTLDAALTLRCWSMNIQGQLSQQMLELSKRWQGVFLARTGDGFLAVVDSSVLDEIAAQFRPRLSDATVSVGLGPSPKDAYLALKLCKARNRGGGLYLSMEGNKEEVLWKAPLIEPFECTQ